jgi:hypothetical protein
VKAVMYSCALRAHRVSGGPRLVFSKLQQIALFLSGIPVASLKIPLPISRNQFLSLGV